MPRAFLNTKSVIFWIWRIRYEKKNGGAWLLYRNEYAAWCMRHKAGCTGEYHCIAEKR